MAVRTDAVSCVDKRDVKAVGVGDEDSCDDIGIGSSLGVTVVGVQIWFQ